MQSAFATFRLPPKWFTDTYGPEFGPKMATHYEQEFQKFSTATEKLYGNLHAAAENSIDTHTRKFAPHSLPGYKPSPPSVLPVLAIHYFDVEYGRNAITGDKGYGGDTILRWGWSNKSTGSFVYVDGAFRFFGPGTDPFWDSLGQPPEPACSDSPPVPGRLTYRFPPTEVYSTPGKKNRVLGKVQMDVPVAADGSVKHVEIVSGDPLLLDVAREEAMRWFYFPPFRKCGQPVEGIARGCGFSWAVTCLIAIPTP
jgi:hypothetical protein